MGKIEEARLSVDFRGNINVLQQLLTKAKKKAGSSSELGRMLGYRTRSTCTSIINKWGNGIQQMPLEKLQKICEYVNADLSTILLSSNIIIEDRYAHRKVPNNYLMDE